MQFENMYLLVFGSTGSSLLRVGFLQLWHAGSVALWPEKPSRTRDQTCVPCIGFGRGFSTTEPLGCLLSIFIEGRIILLYNF